MKLAAVAGILDPYGGLRVVVTNDDLKFRSHVRCDEILFVVPGFRTKVPVPWHEIPSVIKRVERYIAEWVETRNDSSWLDELPVKMYLIRCRPTTRKRSTDLDAVVMG